MCLDAEASALLPPAAGIEYEGPIFAPLAGGWAGTDQKKKLIGAAGELFVFELLRWALGESGECLSREVWQTPVRALVAEGHAEYAGMAGWPREERADIVIEDHDNGGAEEAGPAATLVRLLRRGVGEPRASAPLLRRGQDDDGSVWGAVLHERRAVQEGAN
ncbi:hypothetical protein V8F33_011872 [Rhypophila sp. PSN 637]